MSARPSDAIADRAARRRAGTATEELLAEAGVEIEDTDDSDDATEDSER